MSGLFRTWLFCFVAALGALAIVCVAGSQHLLDDTTSDADSESDEPEFPSEGDADDVESDCDEPTVPAQRHVETLPAGHQRIGFGRTPDRPPISHVLDREPRPPCQA